MSVVLSLPCPAPTIQKASSAGMLVALAVALLVALVAADARVDGVAPSVPAVPVPIAGMFTGNYADGVPIYRLPPIEVTARREAR